MKNASTCTISVPQLSAELKGEAEEVSLEERVVAALLVSIMYLFS